MSQNQSNMLQNLHDRHVNRPIRTSKHARPHSALGVNMVVRDWRQELADRRHIWITWITMSPILTNS